MKQVDISAGKVICTSLFLLYLTNIIFLCGCTFGSPYLCVTVGVWDMYTPERRF